MAAEDPAQPSQSQACPPGKNTHQRAPDPTTHRALAWCQPHVLKGKPAGVIFFHDHSRLDASCPFGGLQLFERVFSTVQFTKGNYE